jgi:hypothetical protein
VVATAAMPAYGFEAAAGFAAVEEGDDRVRPGAALHLGINDFYRGRVYYYGREFGPVTEKTYLVSFSRRWGLFRSNAFQASLGMAAMNESITLEFDGEDAVEDEDENNYNLGAAFGVSWALPVKATAPFYMSASWDSHVFPAGLDGGILLSSGRKQTISVILGMAL